MALVWLALLLADWTGRFLWYHWQSVVVNTDVAAGAVDGLQQPRRHSVGILRGGNLSTMIAIPAVRRQFELERAPFTEWSDEFGYSNEPVGTNTFPVVVAGDSFMLVPDEPSARISAQLSRIAGLPVYNHAMKGRGPFLGVVRFFQNRFFQVHPPKILVFGLVEGDLAGGLYVSLIYQLEHPPTNMSGARAGTRVNWGQLHPAVLKNSLPNTSLLAQAMRKAWTYIRYYGWGQVASDVVIADGQVAGHSMLLYRHNLVSAGWGSETRRLPQVVMAMKHLDDTCARRGIDLLLVLIPDKEQVYRELIPAHWNPPDKPLPPSCLMELEAQLNAANVPVVNLLPIFRERALAGELLYWPDDTHWNPAGIQLAAEQIWPVMRTLLKGPALYE